jgi:hypothetical protein
MVRATIMITAITITGPPTANTRLDFAMAAVASISQPWRVVWPNPEPVRVAVWIAEPVEIVLSPAVIPLVARGIPMKTAVKTTICKVGAQKFRRVVGRENANSPTQSTRRLVDLVLTALRVQFQNVSTQMDALSPERS